MTNLREERVFYNERFFGEMFDFRSRVLFWRFDGCTFVDCNILIDETTEQLAFTKCIFKDCNIDHLAVDEARAFTGRDNFFDRPVAERKADFDRRLAETLNKRLTP